MMDIAFPFHVEVVVRGYELDQWGHVNNAVYLHYLEHARWEMARQGSLGSATTGVMAVVRHLDVSYEREVLLGDTLRVILWPRRVGSTSFTLGGAIRIVAAVKPERIGIVALRAVQTLACIRRPEGKVAVPDAWRAIFPAADPGDAVPAGA